MANPAVMRGKRLETNIYIYGGSLIKQPSGFAHVINVPSPMFSSTLHFYQKLACVGYIYIFVYYLFVHVYMKRHVFKTE